MEGGLKSGGGSQKVGGSTQPKKPIIEQFEDLAVWQKAQEVAVLVYQLTKKFPKDEVFGLTSQLRRAVVSVSANIAEGFGRKSPKDKLHFYTMAYGSLLETKNFLYLSVRLKYAQRSDIDPVLIEIVSCQKLLNAFMRPLKSHV
jgi:four helix bundle protein